MHYIAVTFQAQDPSPTQPTQHAPIHVVDSSNYAIYGLDFGFKDFVVCGSSLGCLAVVVAPNPEL